MPSQIDIIKGHLDDAVAKGATVVLGGPDGVGERFVQPTILTHVPEDSTEITHETFGPTLAVNPVTSMDEAVELTNATKNSLAGAVFSKKNGMAIAERVRSGMTSINSVIAFAGVPSLPFGGVGESGFGRIHGPDGLKEFTYAKAITRQRFKPLLALTTFARDAKTDSRAAKLISMHARREEHAAQAVTSSGVVHGRGLHAREAGLPARARRGVPRGLPGGPEPVPGPARRPRTPAHRTFLRGTSFRRAPSIFHWHYSDRFFTVVAVTGAVLAAATVLGVTDRLPLPVAMLVWLVLWALYLSDRQRRSALVLLRLGVAAARGRVHRDLPGQQQRRATAAGADRPALAAVPAGVRRRADQAAR